VNTAVRPIFLFSHYIVISIEKFNSKHFLNYDLTSASGYFWPVNDCYCNLWMCFIKNNCRIDFLVPENIKNDILFMFLSHLVAKIWAELDFHNSMVAILDFVNFKHVSGNRKNDNIIFLHLAYILKLN